MIAEMLRVRRSATSRPQAALAGMVVVAALLAVPGVAEAAPSGSIVYVKDHNVWLMTPDGTTQHRVTADGSTAKSYEHPSQTSAGQIFAVVDESYSGGNQRSVVHRMDQAGTPLQAPFTPPQPAPGDPGPTVYKAYGFTGAQVNADGSRIAYSPMYQCGPSITNLCYFTLLANADGSAGAPQIDGTTSMWMPEWVSNSRLVMAFGSTRLTYGDAGGTAATWHDPYDYEAGHGASHPAVAPAAGRVAYIATTYHDDQAYETVILGTSNGPPASVTDQCWYFGFPGDVRNLSFSPAGDALAFEVSDSNGASAEGQGLYILNVAGVTEANCGAATGGLVVPGGTQPHWSAAPFAPPTPPPGGGGGGGGGDAGAPGFDGDPATTQRLGQADATGMAVAISQSRFRSAAGYSDAGEWTAAYSSTHRAASHVVLSRDDDFPDSLAGSTLTANGPLLFTATGALSPATRAEIQRVLAPGGRVYLLGGTVAINAAVENGLRADGYDTLRLSGPTRFETAIAVANEVRRLYPAVTQVGLARAAGPSTNPTAGWADSVTGGGWAASRGVPIMVTQTDRLHSAVAAWMAANPPSQTVLFGGTAALSDAVARSVPNARRVAGGDRAGTAARIATDLWGAPTTGTRRFVIINGFHTQGWAYGLAAGGLAADAGAPILMTNSGSVPNETQVLVSSCGQAQVDLLLAGGTNVISDEIRAQLDALDPGPC
jgi:putative cell wall-binding protein